MPENAHSIVSIANNFLNQNPHMKTSYITTNLKVICNGTAIDKPIAVCKGKLWKMQITHN